MDVFEKLIQEGSLKSEHRILKRGEMLCRPGLVHTDIYFVMSGSIRVYILDVDTEHVIRFGYRNSFITALDSYITKEPTKFYMEAIKKSEVLVINKDDFEELLEKDANYMKAWQVALLDLVNGQMERELDLLTASPAERYQRVFERSPQLFQEIPSRYIASYLRMSPETLSRLKKS